MAQRLFVLFALLSISISAPAQWLNYPAPGTPRTPDGKVNLTAPAPRTVNGKPDLSGTWHVEVTSVAEFKRLFGEGLVNEAGKLDVPGMELDTVSKYAVSILVDYQPEQVS